MTIQTFGRRVLSTTGVPTQVSADGSPEWKVGGITLDWATVTAEVSDRTLTDGTVIKAGAKGLEYGTILCAKVVPEVQTISIDATGGTFTISGNSNTTPATAYNASAATVQTNIRALGGSYANVTVTKVQNRWTLTEQPGTDGGTFDLRITRNGVSRLIAGLAWDIASTTTLDAAIEALDIIGTGGVAATGSAGGPYTLVFAPTLGDIEVEIANDLTSDGGVLEGGLTLANLAGGAYVITFPAGSGNVTAVTTSAASLTGGAQTATVATATGGDATGTYGPYNSAATDGRQNLTRGSCYILNETVTELGPLGLGEAPSSHPAVFDGGRVWRARLKINGANPTSIGGNQPSVAAFEAAFPRIQYVDL
jgi:hypothetical protein